jgi:tRNA pseudouridine55 synthase
MSPPDIGVGGILLLDKPVGLSSNDALQRVRRYYGRVKAGHTGSLDPLASGMLPICLGEATKLAGELLAGRKCYTFSVQLGEARTTGDAEGAVVEQAPVPDLTPARIEAALASLRGPQMQVPPMYSALKHQGQPLYRLARQGIEVARAPRPVTIYGLELLDYLPPAVLLARTHCSSGTYVRTLGEQLARALGTCGFLTALRRDFVEPFELEAMWTLQQLDAGQFPRQLLGADRAAPQLPAVRLDVAASRAIRRGQQVAPGQYTVDPAVDASGAVRLYDDLGGFFGLGELDPRGGLKARRLYASS